MKKNFIAWMKVLSSTIISIILGFALLLMVYNIPAASIQNNVRESIPAVEKEGPGRILTNICTSKLDGYTDAIMMNIAAYDGEENILSKSLLQYFYMQPDTSPTDTLITLYRDNKIFDTQKTNYSRYWHGYLIWLKPMLTIFNYGQIRLINIIIQTLINLLICFLLYKRKLYKYILAYILSICMLMPVAIGLCMQYYSIFYVFAVSIVLILIFNEKWYNKDSYMIFFTLIGVATAYFDFLTYPIATIGMPLTMYFIINDNQKLSEQIKTAFIFLICWGFGYAGMWAGKWILATLLTDENIIADAVSSILFRTSQKIDLASEERFSLVTLFWVNIYCFFRTPVSLVIIAYLLYEFITILKIYKQTVKKADAVSIIIFVIICTLPICWYLFAKEHSFLHRNFTSKALIVSVFSIMSMMTKLKEKLSAHLNLI